MERPELGPADAPVRFRVDVVCPVCRGPLRSRGDHITCPACARRFEYVDGIPDLIVGGR
jgi:tRNA(Ile2) C34 agmatinyltransferase TiaS